MPSQKDAKVMELADQVALITAVDVAAALAIASAERTLVPADGAVLFETRFAELILETAATR